MTDRVYLYDTTLRDGAQTQGIDFSVVDKQEIIGQLNSLGIDFIEAGFPGANPTDDLLFGDLPESKNSEIVAFGMTRRSGTSAANDPGLNALLNSGISTACIFGKTWDFQATEALGVSLEENLAMISESVAYLSTKIDVFFDAEHFFDGYKANAEYALKTIVAARDSGARWIILCDTNGGTLPHEITDIVTEVSKHIDGKYLGIHCHNDTENAVANTLAAVRAGVRQVQGTLNGCGERCGNANLISLIPTLMLKMKYDVGISEDQLVNLRKISRFLDERLNRSGNKHAPYVGDSAFAHKGGLHVSAVVKNPKAYEHIEPELVGNERILLVSDQAGGSNIKKRLSDMGVDVDADGMKVKIRELVDLVKERESQGYAYENADASFEILALNALGKTTSPFKLNMFRVIDERRWNNNDELITVSEAKVKLTVDGVERLEVSEGNGPVNALNKALKRALKKKYPLLMDCYLIDFRVRIIAPERATEAVTRVQIETEDNDGNRWITVGVSSNIIDASYVALRDAYHYKIIKG
jgi:2-isopropylmalate synthase